MAMLWVFKRDPALNNAQGFVDVPDVLAERLIQEGKAAAQYDQTLEMEPAQPGDGEDAVARAEKRTKPDADTPPPQNTDTPQNAAQGVSADVETSQRKRGRKP